MYICIHMYVHTYVHIYIYIHQNIDTPSHLDVCIHGYTRVPVQLHPSTSIYTCIAYIYICVCVCVYTNMHIGICIYIYTCMYEYI